MSNVSSVSFIIYFTISSGEWFLTFVGLSLVTLEVKDTHTVCPQHWAPSSLCWSVWYCRKNQLKPNFRAQTPGADSGSRELSLDKLCVEKLLVCYCYLPFVQWLPQALNNTGDTTGYLQRIISKFSKSPLCVCEDGRCFYILVGTKCPYKCVYALLSLPPPWLWRKCNVVDHILSNSVSSTVWTQRSCFSLNQWCLIWSVSPWKRFYDH